MLVRLVLVFCVAAMMPTDVSGPKVAQSRRSTATTVKQHPIPQAVAPSLRAYPVRLPAVALDRRPEPNHVFVDRGELAEGTREIKRFHLPKLEKIKVTLIGDSVRYVFRSPAGSIIVPGETPSDSSYLNYGAWDQLSTFTLQHPASGEWSVSLKSTAIATTRPYAIDFRADGSLDEAAHMEIMLRDSTPSAAAIARPGDLVLVRVFVLKGRRPQSATKWDVRTLSPADKLESIRVHDDGRHADGRAGDGIAVGAFVPQGPDGLYTLRAEARTPRGVAYVVAGDVQVEAKNDLLIPAPIEIRPNSPTAGQPVTCAVTVLNDGSVESKGVTLTFYVDGFKQAAHHCDLQAGESRRFESTWTPPHARDYVVRLTIDPSIEPSTSDFTNNTRTAVIKVR